MSESDPGDAWLFPGQGAQQVGMGHDLYQTFPTARALFDRADAALGRSLSTLIFDGPEEDLRQTVNTQPAIFVTSLACLAAAREVNPLAQAPPAFMAGHSLGEYSALVATNALAFDDGIRLVQERGRLMQEAGQTNPGTLAAILGLAEPDVAAICRDSGAELCNLNAEEQIVIGGPRAAVERASQLATARGARRAVPLNVSAAFHSSLMRPAADALVPHLARATFRAPEVPVVANVTALPLATGETVRAELAAQICSPVRWRQTVEFLLDQGVRRFIEIGPGAVLSGLVKTIARPTRPALINFHDVESIRDAR